MTYTLTSIKKEFKEHIKKGWKVSEITMSLEEFGDGCNLHCNVWMYDEHNNEKIECYTMSKEIRMGEGVRKAMRTVDALISAGYQNTKYDSVLS